MSKRSGPPFRAEHVGSLLRPRELKDAFAAHNAGTLGQSEFDEVLERSIRDAIRIQEDAGLQSITDGEFRRTAWSFGFVRAVDGFDEADSLFSFRDDSGATLNFRTCYAAGKLRRARPIALGEWEFVRRHTNRTPKITMPTPSFMHFLRVDQCADRKVYPDLEEYWADLIAIYQEELRELGRAGVTYLQLDEVPLAMLCDAEVRYKVGAMGSDPDELVGRYIGAVNRVLEARPHGMTIAMHLCRGNLRGMWLASGSYDAIAQRLFSEAAVDGFLLEFDTARAGDFAPLRHIPQNKTANLGLVSSKTPVLENKDGLKRRIDEASRYVPLERLGICPQCGFASTVGGNPLTVEDEKAKLRLVADVAREVWS